MAVPIDPVTRDDSIAGVHRIDAVSIALDGASAYLDVRHAMVDLDAAASIATQHAAFDGDLLGAARAIGLNVYAVLRLGSVRIAEFRVDHAHTARAANGEALPPVAEAAYA